MVVSKTSDHIHIKSRCQTPVSNLEHTPELQSRTSMTWMSFKIKIESQNLEHGCIKDQWPYPNQDQDAKPLSGTSSTLQSPKWGLKGHGCSLHLQIQDREPKFRSWVYQRPVTIFKWTWRCQTQVRILQSPPAPQMKTQRTWIFFANSKYGCTKDQWSYPNQYQDAKTPVRNLQRPPKPK